MTVAAHLTLWALGLTNDTAPDEVRDAACRGLLDGVGTALAAARLGAAEPAVGVAAALGGPRKATVIGSGGPRIGAPAAAFANGTLVHALDFDDTHPGGLVHSTAPVLAAAFAVGQEQRATGAEVLLAAVAGMETACRIGAAAPHAFHARGIHATGVAGVLAAALVSARLMRLDVDRTVNALGIAGSSAGGLLEFLSTGSATKQLHPGQAASNGILAARLAAAGATGPDTVFEGEFGVFRALAGRTVAPHQVLGGLGDRWELLRVTPKPYPCCQLIHASLNAAQTVVARMAEAGLTAADVESVKVTVPKEAVPIVCGPDKAYPKTVYDAKFSLAWTLAAMLTDGSVGVDTYSEGCTRRVQLNELAQRVRFVQARGDGEAATAPGRLTVRFRGGRQERAEEPATTAMSDTALMAKFHANAGGMTPDSEHLAAQLRALGTVRGLGPLLDLTAQVAAGKGSVA
ncbi:MmgE/PrpD family protein [Yinghuangia seranimata]|uniref:MmgE/PrpD family protein n=1 Tax=Yinghuangia seranimata TaxID=408067 RepID=UPI00248AC531|nr:MmgE/PrpD family protein [Yinghuangia seranimata]MDI2131874.1 MmgE/PrpD family protein [Yinghuangia seranimata]